MILCEFITPSPHTHSHTTAINNYFRYYGKIKVTEIQSLHHHCIILGTFVFSSIRRFSVCRRTISQTQILYVKYLSKLQIINTLDLDLICICPTLVYPAG